MVQKVLITRKYGVYIYLKYQILNNYMSVLLKIKGVITHGDPLYIAYVYFCTVITYIPIHISYMYIVHSTYYITYCTFVPIWKVMRDQCKIKIKQNS